MSDDVLERLPIRAMTDLEHQIAEQVYQAMNEFSDSTERSLQSADHRIGISDLGFCSERVRRSIAGIPEPPIDNLPAFIGTAIGDYAEQAVMTVWPDAIRQSEVAVNLVGDQGTYRLIGHPDIIRPSGLVLDFKTSYKLDLARRMGPSQYQQFQRHCYARGAYEARLFDPDVMLSDVMVGNVWIDRSATERQLHVNLEPYDQFVVNAAGAWLDDVVYAFRHDEAARKEPPREMCFKACGHAPDCRGRDTDARGLIIDPEQLMAVDMMREAAELEKRAKSLKDEAKETLQDVQGSTGTYSVRWVKIGGGHVEYDRPPYERLDIRAIR